MAVSGLPDVCENHAQCIARLALDMMDMAKNVKMGSQPIVMNLILDNINHFNMILLSYFSCVENNNWNSFW